MPLIQNTPSVLPGDSGEKEKSNCQHDWIARLDDAENDFCSQPRCDQPHQADLTPEKVRQRRYFSEPLTMLSFH